MTNKLIIAAVAVVVVGGGAWYLMQQGGVTPKIGGNVGDSEMVSNESFNEETSLANIMSRGGSWKCSFTSRTTVGDSSGTVYVAGERMRGDFASEVSQVNMTIESHMIRDGEWAYTWSNASPQGFKVPIALADSGSASGSMSGEYFDTNAQVEWRCVAWPTDEGKFVVPGNVSFQTVQ